VKGNAKQLDETAHPFTNASVTILDNQTGDIAGVGLFVAPKYVITCAHVICDAVHVDRTETKPPDEDIYVRLAASKEYPPLSAKIVQSPWRPMVSESTKKPTDIAVLELQSMLNVPVPTIPFSKEITLGNKVVAFGAPIGYDEGTYAEARIVGELADGRYELHGFNNRAKFIEQGFSGGAVIDRDVQAVIGLVATSNSSDGKARIIPVQHLEIAWPELRKSITAAPKLWVEMQTLPYGGPNKIEHFNKDVFNLPDILTPKMWDLISDDKALEKFLFAGDHVKAVNGAVNDFNSMAYQRLKPITESIRGIEQKKRDVENRIRDIESHISILRNVPKPEVPHALRNANSARLHPDVVHQYYYVDFPKYEEQVRINENQVIELQYQIDEKRNCINDLNIQGQRAEAKYQSVDSENRQRASEIESRIPAAQDRDLLNYFSKIENWIDTLSDDPSATMQLLYVFLGLSQTRSQIETSFGNTVPSNQIDKTFESLAKALRVKFKAPPTGIAAIIMQAGHALSSTTSLNAGYVEAIQNILDGSDAQAIHNGREKIAISLNRAPPQTKIPNRKNIKTRDTMKALESDLPALKRQICKDIETIESISAEMKSVYSKAETLQKELKEAIKDMQLHESRYLSLALKLNFFLKLLSTPRRAQLLLPEIVNYSFEMNREFQKRFGVLPPTLIQKISDTRTPKAEMERKRTAHVSYKILQDAEYLDMHLTKFQQAERENDKAIEYIEKHSASIWSGIKRRERWSAIVDVTKEKSGTVKKAILKTFKIRSKND